MDIRIILDMRRVSRYLKTYSTGLDAAGENGIGGALAEELPVSKSS